QGIITIVLILGVIAFPVLMLKHPYSIFSTIASCIMFFVLLFELVLIKGYLSFLFKKRTSSNVFGIIKPSSEVKIRVLIEGHTDSAKQMKIAEISNKRLAVVFFVLSISYSVFMFIFPLVKIILLIINSSSFDHYAFTIFEVTQIDLYGMPIGLILFVFFLIFVIGLFGDEIVMGANDNLSSTATTIALSKYFKKYRPRNTELILASMGAEEIGEQGAKDFAKKHPELLKNTLCFVLECVGAGKELLVIKRDFMHITKYDSEVISLITQAHELYSQSNSDVLPIRVGNLILGSSDASMYSKKGYQSTFVIMLDESSTKPENWHEKTDTVENINKKNLKDILGITICFVKIVDEMYDKK
ncbi:MAG: M28 family metallopeptidase, partial [Candidatus Thorarchaeota archaeon]